MASDGDSDCHHTAGFGAWLLLTQAVFKHTSGKAPRASGTYPEVQTAKAQGWGRAGAAAECLTFVPAAVGG